MFSAITAHYEKCTGVSKSSNQTVANHPKPEIKENAIDTEDKKEDDKPIEVKTKSPKKIAEEVKTRKCGLCQSTVEDLNGKRFCVGCNGMFYDKIEGKFVCKLCKKTFVELKDHYDHADLKHGDEIFAPDANKSNENVKKMGKNVTSSSNVICEFCKNEVPKSYKKHFEMCKNLHSFVKDGNICTFCDKTFKVSKIYTHLQKKHANEIKKNAKEPELIEVNTEKKDKEA